jgi:HlyD family secretion protein
VADLKDDLAGLRIERDREPSRNWRWVSWAVFLILLAAAGAVGWKWITRERVAGVQVADVSERAAGTQAAVLNASGYVTARRRATVSSKITGKVVEVNVEEGMIVTQGQILARLDDSTPKATLALALAQAESARKAVRENEVHLVQAKQTLARVAELRRRGITTDSETDAATADVNGTEARIAATREQVNVADQQVALQRTELDNFVVRAPFTGVAISKDAQPGEMVSPVSGGGGFTRTGICTLVDMNSLEIEVDVNESYINRVRADQKVTAVLDAYPDWQIPAHVIAVVPSADRQKATVLVRIGFDPPSRSGSSRSTSRDDRLDPRILPDMGVKVTFLREADQSPAISAQPTTLAPKAAVVMDNGKSYAFVVNGGTVERRALRLGGTDGDRVEVIGGLHAGDRVVISPPAELKDGARVMIK